MSAPVLPLAGTAAELLRLSAACESRDSDSRTSIVPERAAGTLSEDVGALALLPGSSAEPALHAFLRTLRRMCASVMDPGGPSMAEIDLETLTLALIGYGVDQ